MGTENPIDQSKLTIVFIHWVAIFLCLVCTSGTAGAATMAATEDFSELSLEQLMGIKVTSVSKRAQKISEAPAAVTVVTAEDIRRSGATNIPEALRLVPGLHVAHSDNNRWAITARGFNDVYATKLLVLIDGRAVYSPLFAGVYWDEQDIVLEDVERIEVVRGPGGTLWGANAVNGVINIITKKSSDTAGVMLSGGGGSVEDGIASFRYGHKIGEDIHARIYGKYLHTDTFDPPTPDRTSPNYVANDARRVGRAGFRMDWDATESDLVTFQGEYFNGESDFYTPAGPFLPAGPGTTDSWGVNLLGRWQSAFTEDQDFSVQLYYSRNARESTVTDQSANTFDAEIQYGFGGLPMQHLTVGVNYRLNWDEFKPTPTIIAYSPWSSTDHLISGFFQDEITVVPDVFKAIVGVKLEYNQFSGDEYQPNIRFLWTPERRHTVWAALSRAVRTPSRSEADLDIDRILPTGPTTTLNLRVFGDRSLDAEDLLAAEIGYRAQPLDRLSFDVAAYFNKYDDLLVQEASTFVAGCTAADVCQWQEYQNTSDGIGWGVEASATWAVLEVEDLLAWKLMASYTYMDWDLDPDTARTTPLHQAQVRSQLDLPWNLEADAALYYVGKVEFDDIDDYVRLDVRLGWQPTKNVELSVLGRNLQARRHMEYGQSADALNSRVPRSVFAELVLKY